MAAEDMGKLPEKMRLAFAVTTIVCVVVLAISPLKEFRAEWRQYRRSFVKFAQGRPDTEELLAAYSPNIDQVWLPGMNVTDRCITCHQGVTQASLADASVPEPFRAHPPIPHKVREWGCTICHRGQGSATEAAEAHETTPTWEKPILPAQFLQAGCGGCHQDDLKETPQLGRGREVLRRLNCQACHRLNNLDPPDVGADLSSIGYKVSRQWIYRWLKEPRTITDPDGKVSVNGYETEDEPRMPKFPLNEEELRALSGFLSVQKAKQIETYTIDPASVVLWSKSPELLAQGEARFREMMCTTCHSRAARRTGESERTGGDIGPELTKVGSKVNKEWLIAWLQNPQGYLLRSTMPRYAWSDEALYKVSQYIIGKLVDPTLLADVPQLGAATDEEVETGRRLFREKGCASCHALSGIGAQKESGPDLAAVGVKNASELEFSTARIEHNLIAYIQAKLQDPVSVNPSARMPGYSWKQGDLDAATTALLSQIGTPSTGALQRLVVRRRERSFQAVGAFALVYERYKCYVCHRFNGYGGTLAPDLSYEGSRAQKGWISDFLKNPQAIRPALVLRMPQFGMPDKDAEIAAAFLSIAMQRPGVNPESADLEEGTPAMASTGKELYEGKYRCQGCHAMGETGHYVGPNLNNAGKWLTPGWIEAWLRNPQEVQPDTVEPRRNFTGEEIQALTAYLMTLRTGSNLQTVTKTGKVRVTSQRAGR